MARMPNSPLKKSFPTVAAVCDRRNAEENNGSALIERRYRAFFNRLLANQGAKPAEGLRDIPAKDSSPGAVAPRRIYLQRQP